MNTLIFAAHELLALALFCLAVLHSAKVSHATAIQIRTSLRILGTTSMAALVAPMYGWSPDPVSLLLMIGLLAALLAERRGGFKQRKAP